MSTPHFADRLMHAVADKGTPLMVGLDPRFANLPKSISARGNEKDFASVAACYRTFCQGVIEVVAPFVSCVKPQAAFFEQLGPAGMVALGQVVDDARQAGLLVVMDGKRNDIGSTAEAYARGYLGPKPISAWGCDALTINPYMGDDSLQPMIDRSVETGSGVFALVKTSNPGSRTFQELLSRDAEDGPEAGGMQDGAEPLRLYQTVARWVQSAAAATVGDEGYGVIGAVVGATHPAHLAELRSSMPQTLFLIPGFGAQGGQARDLAVAFDRQGFGAIVNSSRGIIFAHQHARYAAEPDWKTAIKRATNDAIDELKTAVDVAGR